VGVQEKGATEQCSSKKGKRMPAINAPTSARKNNPKVHELVRPPHLRGAGTGAGSECNRENQNSHRSMGAGAAAPQKLARPSVTTRSTASWPNRRLYSTMIARIAESVSAGLLG